MLLLWLIGFICVRGVPYISPDFLTTESSYLRGTIGILPNLLNTLYLIGVALAVALPLGIGAAVYLTEYAENKRVIDCLEFALETLAGIPSIIFGLVGMLLFTQLFGLRQGILAGALTLVMIILPTVVRTTQESLRVVPQAYREGAMALGAGEWHTIRTAALWDEVKDRLHSSALGLSGGQQQRLCIARSLAVEPEVILLDESTSALDPVSTGKIEELLLRLKEKYTVVMVTHNMQQAQRISDKCAFFWLGELVEYGRTQDIFERPRDVRTQGYVSGSMG